MTPRLTFLVVDDSRPMRAILAAILASDGHEVVQANSVSAARDALVARGPDLILTDYNMPGAKGVELVRWVRAQEIHDHVPILVVSSEISAALHERMARAGVDRWIAKPVCVESLLGAVDAVAGRHARPFSGRATRGGVAAFTPRGNHAIQCPPAQRGNYVVLRM